MSTYEEIKVNWEGPFSHEDIINDNIGDNYYVGGQDIGLYQIYGNHLIYGNDVLLYVGMTTDSFMSRLKNRRVITDNNDIENMQIYLGKVFSDKEGINRDVEALKIKKAEALIINVLKPAQNTKYISSVGDAKINSNDDFIIFNFGNYKSLLPELSTQRWWNDEGQNFKIVDEVASKLNKTIYDKDDWYGFVCDENQNIFFGVEYNIWNRDQKPLIIGLDKELLALDILETDFLYIGDDESYYYIEVCENLMEENVMEKCISKINKVMSLVS